MFRDAQRVNTRGYKRQTKTRTWSGVSSRTPFRTRNSRGTKRITLESFTVEERAWGKETDRTRDARKRKEDGLRLIRPRYGFRRRTGQDVLIARKCPARYEIMSARARTSTRKREDNLSRPRPMEFLLSASRNSYLRFRDSSLSLPISYSRDKSRSEIVTTLPKVAYIWARLGPRTSERTFEKRLQDTSFAGERHLFLLCYIRLSCSVARIFLRDNARKYFEKNE